MWPDQGRSGEGPPGMGSGSWEPGHGAARHGGWSLGLRTPGVTHGQDGRLITHGGQKIRKCAIRESDVSLLEPRG